MNPVDPAKAYRLFYPAVPAIVSCSAGGTVYAMLVVSIVSLSNDPPLVGVSSSPSHSTHRAIARAGRFSVAWVGSQLAPALEFLGTTPHTGEDKLLSAGLRHERGGTLDVPVVEGAAAVLECSLWSRHVTGDHELLIGRIEAARAIADFQGYWRFEAYHPVLYAGIQRGSFETYRERPTP
ncbi:MAG: flavin reductase family protein [Nitrososphaerota archaeon]|nr:flavin reductase family protein [Nitrososphaerota archaeon]